MTRNMLTSFCQCPTYCYIGAQELVVFLCLPFLEGGHLCGYCRKETNNDSYGQDFHIVAELADLFLVLFRVSNCLYENGVELTGIR